MHHAAALVEQAAPVRRNTAPAEAPVERPAEAQAEPSGRVFLTAQWRHLAILNWEVEPDLLAPLVPPGLELDFYQGKTLVSMVGFQFFDARLLGLPIPFHRHFEEVNLRFYVFRRVGGQLRLGVVFIREICPRWAVTSVARWVYNEQYVTLPMRHRVTIGTQRDRLHSPPGEKPREEEEDGLDVEYAWRHRRAWRQLSMQASAGGLARRVCP